MAGKTDKGEHDLWHADGRVVRVSSPGEVTAARFDGFIFDKEPTPKQKQAATPASAS